MPLSEKVVEKTLNVGCGLAKGYCINVLSRVSQAAGVTTVEVAYICTLKE
jgi:hypothetical protein